MFHLPSYSLSVSPNLSGWLLQNSLDPDQIVILATVDWPELLLANEEVQAYRHHEILHEIDVECHQIRVVVIRSKRSIAS